MTDQQKTDPTSLQKMQRMDHAELGRLAEMAEWLKRGDDGAEGSVLLSASVAAEHAADLQALLSDNAALRAERDEAVVLLKPFAAAADDLDEDMGDLANIWEAPAAMNLDAGHLRAALTFLQSIARETGK